VKLGELLGGYTVEYNQLKKVIGDLLTDCTSGISIYNKTPKKASYPYIFYSFSGSSYETRLRGDFFLEVEFWDNREDTERTEPQAENVKNSLDFGYYNDKNGFFHSYIDFYAEIPEQTPNVSRIQQRYLLKVR
jgi:hypothetical protein